MALKDKSTKELLSRYKYLRENPDGLTSDCFWEQEMSIYFELKRRGHVFKKAKAKK